MIEIQTLISKLIISNYEITEARETIPDLEFKKIYISYATIAPIRVINPIDNMILNQHGEDLVQTFDIQIVCPTIDFSSVWSSIYSQLYGWNPTSNEVNASGFVKGEGGKLGIVNGNLHWVDRWMISFPTLNVAL
jgi:hypothetical protein